MAPVRVLIVDDSPTMRGMIAATLRREGGIEIVGEAGDPFEARDAIKRLNPDVITLDVEMPRMSGIEFLEKIMRLRPMPVVMISTLTQAGAATSIEALEIGAIECVGKPDFAGLADKVKAAAGARVRALRPAAVPASPPHRAAYRPGNKVLAIGSSTGGVEALLTMLAHFPANCPPTLIAQHMPGTFTPSFAARLDRAIAPSVVEAFDGAPLKPGQIYLAPGGKAHLTIAGATQLHCRLVDSDPVNGHRPSVDVLFRSAARLGARAVGVILTGMGRDGAAGLLDIRNASGRTIGQDENSSVVYGMPRVAAELGAVETQLALEKIGDLALQHCADATAGVH
jgi:two-component system chemotaxis response regulator CheB